MAKTPKQGILTASSGFGGSWGIRWIKFKAKAALAWPSCWMACCCLFGSNFLEMSIIWFNSINFVLNYSMSPDKIKREIGNAFEVIKNRSTDDEIYILCPVSGCDDKTGNRSINVKTLYTHCWRCHDPQPHHVKSLFKLKGLEWADDEGSDGFEGFGQQLMEGDMRKAVTPVQDIELPTGFELLSNNRKSCYWRFCRDMAERKHLSIEDLEEAGAGFTRTGPWEPFCIFPVYEGMRCVYYQGRTYNDEGFESTKRFPGKKEVPYGPSYWVYNLDALTDLQVSRVIVVESILNALSLRHKLRELDVAHIAPVCVFTHRLSRSQVAKFQRYRHIKEFCILFDSDSSDLAVETGARLGALLPVTVARMPHSRSADGTARLTNDANDDVEAALYAVTERQTPLPQDVAMMRLGKDFPGARGSLAHDPGAKL